MFSWKYLVAVLVAGVLALVVLLFAWIKGVTRRRRALVALNDAGRFDDALVLAREWAEQPGLFWRMSAALLSPGLWDLFYLAELEESGRFQDALAILDARLPNLRKPALRVDLLDRRARLLKDLGRPREAEQAYEEALASAEGLEERSSAFNLGILRCNRALVPLSEGRIDAALERLAEADPDGKQLTTHHNRGHMLFWKGDFAGALETALRTFPNLAGAWDPAARSIDLAAEGWRAPGKGLSDPVLRMLVWILCAQAATAGRFTARVSDRGPWELPVTSRNRLLSLPHRGLLLAADGRKQEALDLVAEFAPLLEKAPPIPTYHVALETAMSSFWRSMGDPRRAAGHAERAVQPARTPLDRHAAHYELARVQEALGDRGAAADSYRRCLDERVGSFLSQGARGRLDQLKA